MFRYPLVYFYGGEISLKEHVCHCTSFRYISVCCSGWSKLCKQTAAAEASAPAACPAGSSSPTTETLCLKQTAIHTGIIARRQLLVLHHFRMAWIPAELSLQVQHGGRQKQRDPVKGISKSFPGPILMLLLGGWTAWLLPLQFHASHSLTLKNIQSSNSSLQCAFPNTVSCPSRCYCNARK